MFYVTIGGLEFKDSSLLRLVSNIEHSEIVLLNEDVLYHGSLRFEKTKMVRLESNGKYFYDGRESQCSVENVFPLTEKNEKLLEEYERIKNEGWKLIRQADSVIPKLDKFEKDHFQKVIDKRLQEINEKRQKK
jgi:hypothetical protein